MKLDKTTPEQAQAHIGQQVYWLYTNTYYHRVDVHNGILTDFDLEDEHCFVVEETKTDALGRILDKDNDTEKVVYTTAYEAALDAREILLGFRAEMDTQIAELDRILYPTASNQ